MFSGGVVLQHVPAPLVDLPGGPRARPVATAAPSAPALPGQPAASLLDQWEHGAPGSGTSGGPVQHDPQ